ncbi:hypothetical protein JOC94_004316 [Bacillus thermophilus]|uniref:Uncharacterized protein n=1 Tax=Siminovitchia thermophila TaxID=1245522 RepID=A0ABS2RCB3_9BACI|nr:hypothetical protein [Siminovitchia thermophila]MBM7717291.1 hypothetical protein [Siminovitchia thermophila]ONK24297.1 hypothetical protein BLX87_06115 [Bacillus sp. VT-16-64]
MEIFIRGLQREIAEVYTDNKRILIGETNRYDVDFVIQIDETFIDANLTIEYEEDLSFDKAEKLIKEKFLSEVKNHATD